MISRTDARKAEKYWASMRTSLKLLAIGDKSSENAVDKCRAELEAILDSGILIYPQTLQEYGIAPDTKLSERKTILGVSERSLDATYEQKLFLKDLEQKAITIRKHNWSWRIGQEAEEKQALGWHPFFVTLTVDPKQADPKEIWTETREFRKYIRRLADIVCAELGHPPCRKKPYRPESDYVTYAGVIEHGKSREHHHGHFVIWMRAVPKTWRTDPNLGIANPADRTRNECKAMSTVWPWSGYDPDTGEYLSPALYFRSIGDVWETRYNFVLPLKDGKPMKVSTPRVAGAYITKYLSKELKEWHHRMKATRSLGMMTLTSYIAGLDIQTATALSWRAKDANLNLSLTKIHSCPLGLVRQLAKRQVFYLKYKSKALSLRELLTANSKLFSMMLSSVKAGARPDRMDSFQFFDWLGQFLPEQTGYCEITQESAHAGLAWYFPPKPMAVKHIKIGALDIGYS